MNQANVYRTQFSQRGFALLTRTSGASMRPLLWGGQHHVAVVPLVGEPRVGDILLFVQRHAGKEVSVVHRLVEVRDDGDGRVYVTRGDNCLECEVVRRNAILGRVAEVHRISGFRPWHIIPLRQFAVTHPAYRCYRCLWSGLWPLRRLFYILRARTCR